MISAHVKITGLNLLHLPSQNKNLIIHLMRLSLHLHMIVHAQCLCSPFSVLASGFWDYFLIGHYTFL